MRTVFAVLLALSGLVVAMVGDAAAQDANLERTAVRFILPYTRDGLASGLTVTSESSGFCTGISLADIGRPDAWSCTDAKTSEILDPCFENPFADPDAGAELACMSSPFDTKVVRFTTSESLPRFKEAMTDAAVSPLPPTASDEYGNIQIVAPPSPSDIGETAEVAIDPLDIPWAIELANGARCGLMTGATTVLAGERMNYVCDDGGFVLGEVDRSLPVWNVSYLGKNTFATDFIPVTIAWT
ncbi:MAG: hypothetical protein U0031_03460 [Thermomicrobiales bacterium]